MHMSWCSKLRSSVFLLVKSVVGFFIGCHLFELHLKIVSIYLGPQLVQREAGHIGDEVFDSARDQEPPGPRLPAEEIALRAVKHR